MTVDLDAIAQRGRCEVSSLRLALPLIEQGYTPPFLSRYRRDELGDIDEASLWNLAHAVRTQKKLDEYRADLQTAWQQTPLADPAIGRAIGNAQSKRLLDRLSRRVKLESGESAGLAQRLAVRVLNPRKGDGEDLKGLAEALAAEPAATEAAADGEAPATENAPADVDGVLAKLDATIAKRLIGDPRIVSAAVRWLSRNAKIRVMEVHDPHIQTGDDSAESAESQPKGQKSKDASDAPAEAQPSVDAAKPAAEAATETTEAAPAAETPVAEAATPETAAPETAAVKPVASEPVAPAGEQPAATSEPTAAETPATAETAPGAAPAEPVASEAPAADAPAADATPAADAGKPAESEAPVAADQSAESVTKTAPAAKPAPAAKAAPAKAKPKKSKKISPRQRRRRWLVSTLKPLAGKSMPANKLSSFQLVMLGRALRSQVAQCAFDYDAAKLVAELQKTAAGFNRPLADRLSGLVLENEAIIRDAAEAAWWDELQEQASSRLVAIAADNLHSQINRGGVEAKVVMSIDAVGPRTAATSIVSADGRLLHC
ncbi:MAG: Tex-like N-terminal domain-containing protein, partial [Rhodopirellula sp. JB055]|uniref:Tex-like N-terminal domain-containing protein n=1 Tax=Rhodopirellula sp. JB055 TaxID=3342846 RepID=UPI00370CB1C0